MYKDLATTEYPAIPCHIGPTLSHKEKMGSCSVPSELLKIEHGTRYAVSDINKRGSYFSSWLRGTRYAVNDIFKRGSCLSSWLRGTRYAVYDINKTGNCFSS